MSADYGVIAQEDLPPVEYLIMETLAARHRLGEHGWVFPGKVKAGLSSLARRGLIGFEASPSPGYQRAWLTDAGRACCLSDTYTPPLRLATEWAVRTACGSVLPYDDEQDAREHVALYSPSAVVVRREVTWTGWEVPADEH